MSPEPSRAAARKKYGVIRRSDNFIFGKAIGMPILPMMTALFDQFDTRIVRIATWSAADHRRFLHALLLVVVNRLALWIIPFRILQRITDIPRRDIAASDIHEPPERITRDVISAARFMPEASCLTQALAARILLRRAGLDAELLLGVGRDQNGVFKAHAWIKCDGRVVIGDFTDNLPFVPLAGSLDSASR